MSVGRTVVVLVIAAVLAAAAWLGSAGPVSGDGAGTGPSRLLAPGRLPVDAVDRIEITRPGEPALVLVRHRDEWWQQEPFRHRIMPFSARQLVVQAAELQASDVVDAERLSGGLSAEALSLAPPLATVTYRWPDGALTLHLGRTGLAGRAFLRLDDEPDVRVVGQGLHERVVAGDPREWRDRRLFTIAGAEADRIELSDSVRRTTLVRDGRRWSMTEPVRTRVDPVVRDAFFQALGRASSRGFIKDQPDDLARFGLAAPDGRVAITGSRPEQREGQVERVPFSESLLVGARVGGSQDRFAMMEGAPSVFRLPAEAIVALFRDPRELADPTASGVSAADVKAVVIRTTGDDELMLQRELDRWVALNQGSADASGPEVPATLAEELLHQLTELRAPKIEIWAFPADLEVATITLLGFDRRPLDTVRVIRSPDTGEWGLENGDGVIRVFPASMTLRLEREEYGIGG